MSIIRLGPSPGPAPCARAAARKFASGTGEKMTDGPDLTVIKEPCRSRAQIVTVLIRFFCDKSEHTGHC